MISMVDHNASEGKATSRWVSVEDAAIELGVQRSTMYYYIKQLKISAKKRFPLDRRSYMTRTDLGRIKAAKQAAAERRH
jgi:predicted DNA-binding transcriptional regulator AlpA